MTLTEFLLARIAEDEAEAVAWGTARVLAECEIKRRIVERYGDRGGPLNLNEDDSNLTRGVIKELASVYTDHPDYQQEWAP